MTQVSIVSSLADFDALVPEWQALLADAVGEPELQHDPAVIRLSLVDPQEPREPLFVVCRQDGQIRGLAPFYFQRTEVPLRLSVLKLASFSARVLRLFGDRIILRRGENADAVIDQIFAGLQGQRQRFDLLWVYTQRLDDPLWQFLSTPSGGKGRFEVVVTSPQLEKVHQIVFDRPVEDYKADIRTKPGYPGKTLKRFWRDMKDRATVVRVTAPGDVAAFLDDLDRVYNQSWQARTYGARQRNRSVDVARLEAIARLGYLRSYLLKEDGKATAFVLGYQSRGRYQYEETGYDSARSATSPGSVLTHAAIEDLFTWDPPSILDFGFGDGAYKRTFGTRAYDVCSLYVVSRRKWRMILRVQRWLNSSYSMIRTGLVRLRLDVPVRRMLKRQR